MDNDTHKPGSMAYVPLSAMKEKKVICLKYVNRKEHLKSAHRKFSILGPGIFRMLISLLSKEGIKG